MFSICSIIVLFVIVVTFSIWPFFSFYFFLKTKNPMIHDKTYIWLDLTPWAICDVISIFKTMVQTIELVHPDSVLIVILILLKDLRK